MCTSSISNGSIQFTSLQRYTLVKKIIYTYTCKQTGNFELNMLKRINMKSMQKNFGYNFNYVQFINCYLFLATSLFIILCAVSTNQL